MKKALIAYGTRYGATADTAGTIGETLEQEGMEVDVVDLKRQKVKGVADYDLVVVGSGIQINRWTAGPRRFLKRHRQELAGRKLALFVCCGSATPMDDKEDKASTIEKARKDYLEAIASQYGLHPTALGLFGAVYDYNRMSGLFRKTMEPMKATLEAAGIPQTEPGRYDARDLEAIRDWARALARE